MKVIQQLITYLDSRGILTSDDVSYLRSEGYLSPELLVEFDERALSPADAAVLEPWELSEEEPALEREAVARRRKGRVQRKAHVMTAQEISARLAGRIPEWTEALEPLVQIAGRLAPGVSLEDTPALLCRADPGSLEAAVAAALQDRRPSLKKLWAALSLEDYRGVVEEPGLSGAAVRAYRAVLAADDYGPRGKSGWILREREIAWTYDLARAQWRLVAACGGLYDTDPELISRELGREWHDGAFWAFTLLYSAHRFVRSLKAVSDPLPPTDCVVGRAAPDRSTWIRAWSQAWIMDPSTVMRFMADYLSPGNFSLASGSDDGTVWLWNAQTGESRVLVHDKDLDPVSAVITSPDGETLISADATWTVKLWDWRTGELRAILAWPSIGVHSMAISPDGRMLACGVNAGEVRLWDLHADLCLPTLCGQSGPVRSVAFAPDGKTLASAAQGPGVQLWDTQTWKALAARPDDSSLIYSVAFSPDGRTLACGGGGGSVWLWEPGTGKTKPALHEQNQSVQSVAFSRDGRRLASGCLDGTIKLWDAGTLQVQAVLWGHLSSVQSVAFSPDGVVLVSVSQDRTVRLWDTRTGRLITTLAGPDRGVNAVTFLQTAFALVCPARWHHGL